MLTLPQQIEGCQAESARLWAAAGDESKTPHERYCCAWGAMDYDLELELLLEELALQTSQAAERNRQPLTERNKPQMHLNKVMIIGFTGKDAKTSATPGGKVMTRLSVATTKRYKNTNDEWKSSTQWHEVVIHGKSADYAGRITKGAHVLIEGELTYREYQRTVETDSGPVNILWPITEIHADNIRLLDRSSQQEERGPA